MHAPALIPGNWPQNDDGFIVSASTGEAVFRDLGLPFLSGAIAIMHIVCWTPALVLLLTRKPFLDPEQGRWFLI